MAEDDFSRLQGDSYTGSNYANFTGGGLSPQGNVSSAATTNATTQAATSAASDAPPTPVQAPATPTPTTASPGLTSVPSPTKALTSAAEGAGASFAGQAIGQAAGAAIGSGATFGSGISQGISSLANKVSGGLVGTASTPANIIGNSGATQSTTAAFDTASKASDVGSLGSGANLGGAAGAGLASAAITLLQGGGIAKAAKTGAGTAVGTAVGSALGSYVPVVGTAVGGFIGGAIGGAVGGRVICTQLVKDGLISKEDQHLDMEFTFRALSHVHVRGYLFWARPYVEKMKKNPALRDRTLKIVVWRLNEIKYQVGLSKKPDWRGKIVRFIMENFCLAVGLFVPDTAESIIYKKENKHVSA